MALKAGAETSSAVITMLLRALIGTFAISIQERRWRTLLWNILLGLLHYDYTI
jgi:hypothetical protein